MNALVRSPVTTTLLAIAAAIAFYTAIPLAYGHKESGQGLGDREFGVWIAVEAGIHGVVVALAVPGLAMLRSLPRAWRRGRPWWTWAATVYVTVAVATDLFLDSSGTREMTERLGVRQAEAVGLMSSAIGWLSLSPWVVLLWLAHEQVRDLRRAVGRIRCPAPADEFDPLALDGPAITAAVADSAVVWRVIEACVLVLAVNVSLSVLQSGTMRALLIRASAIDPASFPAALILLHGAMNAAIVAVVALPAMLAWRSASLSLVDRALGVPRCGVPSESLNAARDRLERRLRLDTRLLRQPIGVLSILSPLAVAFLAAFIPKVV